MLDVSGLVTTTVLNKNISEVEREIPETSYKVNMAEIETKYFTTTFEFTNKNKRKHVSWLATIISYKSQIKSSAKQNSKIASVWLKFFRW